MTLPDRPDARWKLVGARRCLDFVNTVGGRVAAAWAAGRRPRRARHARRHPRLRRPAALERLRLARRAAGSGRPARPGAPLAVRRRSRAAARARLPRGPLSHREGADRAASPREADLRLLERELREARRHQRLVPRRGRLESEWASDRPHLDRMLWPIALSGASVLGSDEAERLKQCGGDRCGWLFLDTTRNHSRQWCRMADCGNVAKVRRFRRRQRRSGGRRR